jgi:peptidyl-prolyl cis-trans isomerase SurA
MKLFRLLLAAGFVAAACSSSQSVKTGPSPLKPGKDVVVGTAGSEKIYLSELVHDWKLGVPPEQQPTTEALKEFLPLYADFRLKVLEARAAGYETDSSIVSELRGYQLQIAIPYWFQKELEEELITELVERSKSQLRVSHVLISVPETASYADTARAYNRLIEARKAFLEQKVPMDRLNEQYSSRQQNRAMGGDLGYIDAGWAVKAFEDVAFTTPVGQLSMPFRTKFGYHILFVHDKRPAVAGKKFSHLFLRIQNHRDSLEIVSALERARGFYSQLKSGATWDSVVVKHSEDTYSSRTGGSIGWVDYSKGFRPQFIDTVMKLNKPGEMKAPFYSSYGVHIVRLDSIESPKTVEQQREAWRGKLKQMDRYSEGRKTVFDKVWKLGNARVDGQALEKLKLSMRPAAPQRVKDGIVPDSVKKTVLFAIAGNTYTAMDFWTWAVENNPDEPLYSSVDKLFETFKDQKTELAMLQVTAQRFKDFAELSNRYRNGLTVYKVTEDSVWEYAKTDTSRLRSLYNAKGADYMFGVRFGFKRYAADSDSLARIVEKRLKAGTYGDSVHAGLKGVFYEASELNSLDDEPFDRLVGLKPGEWTAPFEFRKRINILLLESVKAPEQMSYRDAEFRLITDYQKIREEEWLAGLRRKYSLTLQFDKVRW